MRWRKKKDEKHTQWWHKRHNAAYGRVLWCVEQRCKLFGLYAPQEVINWKTEAMQHGYDPDMIYRVLVHEMSTIIDGTAVQVLDIQAPAEVMDVDGTDDTNETE